MPLILENEVSVRSPDNAPLPLTKLWSIWKAGHRLW